ncbi:MFS transporter [Phreatobacter sp.]|uniref:MFS transporter n=1 Tax=Phreatobacter sp. TaxID=1966341 RepID=UPI003F6F70DE
MNNPPPAGLLRPHSRTIAFGFCLAFLSSFGQTYFIALSVPDIQSAFGLSHGQVGGIFSGATLLSGIVMIWAGAWIDRVHVGTFAALSLVGLACAAFALTIAPTVWLVAAAILALRLFGQGTLSHAALTMTARLPTPVRGRSIGLASLGFQVGGALLPPAGIAAMAAFGWVSAWQAIALALLVMAGLAYRNPLNARELSPVAGAAADGSRYRARILLRDRRFLIFVPAMMGPAAISTGYFFHQRLLADRLAWGLDGLAIGVSLTALVSIAGTMAFGLLVDRFGARRSSRIFLLPLAAASIVLGFATGPYGAAVFFVLMGITTGANGVVITSLLAETFGSEQIGTVRAVAASVMVVASAITPFVMGVAFDAGIGIGPIGLVAAAYLIAASLLCIRAARRP